MAHKALEKDGLSYMAQEVMRVGTGVYCRLLLMDPQTGPISSGKEVFEWIDASVFDAAGEPPLPANSHVPALMVPAAPKYERFPQAATEALRAAMAKPVNGPDDSNASDEGDASVIPRL